MEKGRKLSPLVVVELAGGLVALALYGVSMSLILADPIGGESRIANAYAALAALAALWGALFVLLLIDFARAGRFSPAAILSLLLLPVAAAAQFLATDYPHDLVCRISVAGLPLLFAAYLLLPRKPAEAAGGHGRALVLLSIAALSAWLTVRFLS